MAESKLKAPKGGSSTQSEHKYFEGIGRRKSATARVRIYASDKPEFVVNDKDANDYFSTEDLQYRIRQPLIDTELADKYRVTVKVSGSGVASQADAITLGVARALLEVDEDLRNKLRDNDLLKRDPRKKERKKPGLRKARKSPQWSKR